MGNRAVIAFQTGCTPQSKCIYLHWNGGRASVEGFLQAAKQLNIQPRQGPADTERAITQLATLIAQFFFGCRVGTTVYIEELRYADCDNGDNGLYLIDNQFNIVERRFSSSYEKTEPDKTSAIVDLITSRAPIFNDPPCLRKHRPEDREYDVLDHINYMLKNAAI